MKIDDVIKELKIYKDKFGNIDVKLSDGYTEQETSHSYIKELVIKDCSLSVLSYGSEEPILLIKENIYE